MQRSLAGLVVVLAAGLALGQRAVMTPAEQFEAIQDELRFVSELRNQGKSDLALEYLQRLMKNPSPELAKELTLELAMTLQDVGYGGNGERVGFDLYPYTEDQVQAVRQSVLQWEFIDDLASKIDRSALDETRKTADAVGCYRNIYNTLGLTPDYEKRIMERHRGA